MMLFFQGSPAGLICVLLLTLVLWGQCEACNRDGQSQLHVQRNSLPIFPKVTPLPMPLRQFYCECEDRIICDTFSSCSPCHETVLSIEGSPEVGITPTASPAPFGSGGHRPEKVPPYSFWCRCLRRWIKSRRRCCRCAKRKTCKCWNPWWKKPKYKRPWCRKYCQKRC